MINLDNYMTGSSPYDTAYRMQYDNGDFSLEYQPPQVYKSADDILHTVLEGETLQNIAFRYYQDSGKWYLIAEANKILNPFEDLVSGTIIRIPSNG